MLEVNELNKEKTRAELNVIDINDAIRIKHKDQIKPTTIFDDLIKTAGP
jgi:hypothetical protein